MIPHGAFEHLAAPAAGTADRPLEGLDGRRVVLFFGLVRPYKGVDLLVEAFAATPDDAVLLVVGMPRMPIEPLERRARELGIAERVRFVPRFVPDEELPAYFRRADVVVLPYREIDQSGVLYTALAFGSPLLLSAVGGFPEIAARGAARLVEPGSVESLRAGLIELLADDGARAAPWRRPRGDWRGASTPGTRVAEATERLYRRLLEDAVVKAVEIAFWVSAGLIVYTHVGYPLLLRRPCAVAAPRRCWRISRAAARHRS